MRKSMKSSQSPAAELRPIRPVFNTETDKFCFGELTSSGPDLSHGFTQKVVFRHEGSTFLMNVTWHPGELPVCRCDQIDTGNARDWLLNKFFKGTSFE